MKKHISQDLRSPSQYPSLGFQGKMAPLLGHAQRRHGQIAKHEDAALFRKELKKALDKVSRCECNNHRAKRGY